LSANWKKRSARKECDSAYPAIEPSIGPITGVEPISTRLIRRTSGCTAGTSTTCTPKGFADYKKNHWPPHDQAFKDDWLARTCELVDKYQPDLVWFDFGIAPSWVESYDQNPYAEHLKLFAAYYYNRMAQQDGSAIINYKFNAFPEKAAVLDLERSKMDRIREPFWQTDTAVSTNSWGYVKNHKYKPVNRLVDDLVDIVSKNGCLLLNIGPKPDGTIPAA
jgi:alpha-L-fucosidase